MTRVLVVDDDPSIRELVVDILDSRGYAADVAANGAEALALFPRRPYDLVITDLVMPEQEGLETILELRRIDPEVKILAMSGGGQGPVGTYLNLALHLGAQRALEKPIDPKSMLAAVDDLLHA